MSLAGFGWVKHPCGCKAQTSRGYLCTSLLIWPRASRAPINWYKHENKTLRRMAGIHVHCAHIGTGEFLYGPCNTHTHTPIHTHLVHAGGAGELAHVKRILITAHTQTHTHTHKHTPCARRWRRWACACRTYTNSNPRWPPWSWRPPWGSRLGRCIGSAIYFVCVCMFVCVCQCFFFRFWITFV